MGITIESFGGKPYKAVCEVLERRLDNGLAVDTTEYTISFNANDRKFKNIEMDENGYIQCEEYRYVALMPNFASWATIIAGTVGTLDLEYQIHTVLSESNYTLTAHQSSLFPAHYEYDNTGSTSDADDYITRTSFKHPDYFDAAQVFKIPSRHIFLKVYLTKQNIELWIGSTYGLVLWFIP